MEVRTSEANLARFDLISIRLAVYCHETGSLSAAARRAHMSLSRASQRLSALEDAMGHRLFERHCHGLTPTAEGLTVARHGRALMQTVDRLSRDLARFAAD